MNVNEAIQKRYSTKHFDPAKELTAAEAQTLKELLQLSPSSVNIQPWHFIIASTEEGKARIAKGTQDFYKFNAEKVLHASHVVLFCARIGADDAYLQSISEAEEKAGRYPTPEIKQMNDGARATFRDIHRDQLNDLQIWLDKQVYLNVGFFLMGVAAMGLDAVPMEGLDINIVNKEFDLDSKGLTAVMAVAVGHHTDDDFNMPSKTPKSRLPQADIITEI